MTTTPITAALLALAASAAHAQRPDRAPAYLERYQELLRLAPTAQVAEVAAPLMLQREGARFTLERGHLYTLSPVNGRTVAIVFRGEGRFEFDPPLLEEQAELRRILDAPRLADPVRDVVFLFTETPTEFRALTWTAAGPAAHDVAGHAREVVETFKGDHDGDLDADVMEPMLNPEMRGWFLAHVRRGRGDPVVYLQNPGDIESVALLRPVNRVRWGTRWVPVVQFAPAGAPWAATWRRRERLRIPHYAADTRLTESFSTRLGVHAAVTLQLQAAEPVGPWLRFRLHPELEVDSARWSSGEAVPVFKAERASDLWVLAPRRLARGDSASLTVHYHGGIIDRYADFFFVDPGTAWLPYNGQGEDHATFDLTFRSPVRYPLVAIGTRAESSLTGNVVTTRWMVRRPTPHATFNIGLFELFRARFPEAPPVDVLLSESAHRLIARQFGMALPEQRNMSQTVAGDISNSLKLFTSLYGTPLDSAFVVSEIPYFEGVSFPGLIHLSWGTFQNTSLDGFDEFFRAHEAAHQWWGNAVRPATYRDAWLSEGLATFSGLWYLQSARRRNDDYYRFLDQYRADITAVERGAGPISIGYRSSSPDVPRGYQVMVYEKGAWVFHMLRIMMMDLTTLRSDRFNAMLREYYEQFAGSRASTADFQELAERHAGQRLDWFFNLWIRQNVTPEFRVAWTALPADGGRFTVRLRINATNIPENTRVPVLVAADLGENRVARFRVTVAAGQSELTSPLLPARPRSVRFNEFRGVLADVRTESW